MPIQTVAQKNNLATHYGTKATHAALYTTAAGATPGTEIDGGTPWAAGVAYALGDIRRPTTPNGFVYKVTTAGTSHTAEPTWPTADGSTVTDGTVVWTRDVKAYRRLPIAWGAASDGKVSGTVTFDVPSGVTVASAGVHDHVTAGAYLDGGDLTDQAFSSAGTYQLTLSYTQS